MSSEGWERWIVDASALADLLAEAEGLPFVRIRAGAFGARRSDGRMTSPYDAFASVGGPVAEALGRSDGPRALVEGLVGRPVAFNSATYVLYEDSSYLGCHTDRSGCEANVLILLEGGPADAELLLARRDSDRVSLLHEAHENDGFVPGADRLQLAESGEAIAFLGSVIPHQRRRRERPLLILTLCFGFPRSSATDSGT